MSNNNMTISERLTRVAERANTLCNTVSSQISFINSALSEAEAQSSEFINNARAEQSHILLSSNQQMHLQDANTIKGFNTIGLESLEVTREATLHASNIVDHTGNGVGEDFKANVFNGYVNGYFDIVRLKWKRNMASHPARINDDWYRNYQQGALTTGCYFKLIAGSIGGEIRPYHNFTNGWQLLGAKQSASSISKAFTAPHSKLTLSRNTGEEGEALMCLFGTVSGFVNLEDKIWGLYPEFTKV